jgi:hypothetical protein
MGTSVNQRSPDTLNWRAVRAVYDDPNVPAERALMEVWRAADNQPEGSLPRLLAEPIIGSLAAVAGAAVSVEEAARAAGRLVATSKASSLAVDIARRAVVQSVGRPDAVETFVAKVFAEATNYLVSRDLPGQIRPSGRIENVADSMAFRQEVMSGAEAVARRFAAATPPTPQAWPAYAAALVAELKRR